MNKETGEIKPEAELKPEEKASGKWVSLTIGTIAEFMGVPCELVYMNPGRRRLTLRALGDLKVEPTTDPHRVIEKNILTGTHGLQRPKKSRA